MIGLWEKKCFGHRCLEVLKVVWNTKVNMDFRSNLLGVVLKYLARLSVYILQQNKMEEARDSSDVLYWGLVWEDSQAILRLSHAPAKRLVGLQLKLPQEPKLELYQTCPELAWWECTKLCKNLPIIRLIFTMYRNNFVYVYWAVHYGNFRVSFMPILARWTSHIRFRIDDIYV